MNYSKSCFKIVQKIKRHFFNSLILVLRDKFRVEPEDVGVVKGGTATLNCSPPKGTPNPTVHWKKDGKTVDIEKDKR